MEVVIVGAGTFGASLAWWLARHGEHVTLVDQYEPGDTRASSGGETRLFRCAHGSDSEYTAMACRARTLWRELEEESSEELLVEVRHGLVRAARGWLGGCFRANVRWPRNPLLRVLRSPKPRSSTQKSEGTTLRSSYSSPEGGVLRAERSIRTLAVQRSRAAHASWAAAHDRRAQPSSSRTQRGSRPMSSSGPVGRGSRNSSRTLSRSRHSPGAALFRWRAGLAQTRHSGVVRLRPFVVRHC